MAIINGTGGNDVLTGGAANDEIYGFAGDDTLSGGGGNDLLDGGTGADSMSGGSGNDIYYVDDAGDTVIESPGSGNDTVRATIGAYTLTANVENLELIGPSGPRTATGNGLANLITVIDGAMTVNGAGGVDTLSYANSGGFVLVDLASGVHGGQAFDDTITSIEDVVGSASNDELRGDSLGNILDGGLGADLLIGRMGNDIYLVDNSGDMVTEAPGEGLDEIRVHSLASYALPSDVENLRNMSASAFTGTGNLLNNDMVGNAGVDQFFGGPGHDTLYGQGGDDFLYGGDGHDTLSGGTGVDAMEGSTGNDVYVVDNAGDTVLELVGEGDDKVLSNLATYTLPGQVENLQYNASGNFTGTGNGLGNFIQGGGGADVLDGDAGDDELRGQSGDDVLFGGTGSDTLIAGSGVDVMTGGAGADLFMFSNYETGTGAAADRITDFGAGSDKIDLAAIDADAGVAGNQVFTFIGTAAFSGTAGELRYDHVGADTWLRMDINGDAIADFEIVLSGVPVPVAGDFFL